MTTLDTHGSPELDADAAKLEALGADPGPTLADITPDITPAGVSPQPSPDLKGLEERVTSWLAIMENGGCAEMFDPIADVRALLDKAKVGERAEAADWRIDGPISRSGQELYESDTYHPALEAAARRYGFDNWWGMADAAAVGEAVFNALGPVSAGDPWLKDWTPADCPSEIVLDLSERALEAEARIATLTAERDRMAEDAARWRALLTTTRIRMWGSAGVNPKTGARNDDTYVHFGAEFWSEMGPDYDRAKDPQNTREWGVNALTALADAMIELTARQALSSGDGNG